MSAPFSKFPSLVFLLYPLLGLCPQDAAYARDYPHTQQAEPGPAAGDAARDFVSERFVALIAGIDRFFGGERNFQESNQSVLQLDWNELLEPGGNRQGRFSGRVKLHLPSTEQRFRLLLESDPVQNSTSSTQGNQAQVAGQSASVSDYGLALRYENEKARTWHYSTDVGIRVQAPLDPFVRGRVSYQMPLQDWRMKTTESLFWFNEIGPGAGAQLDFDHSLTANTLFRTGSNAIWLHLPQRLDLRQDFTLFRTLDERQAMQYQASVVGTTRPFTRVEDSILSVLYRRQLHRTWLFFEVNPQFHFPHAQQFRFTPQLWLRLQVLFSKGNAG